MVIMMDFEQLKRLKRVIIAYDYPTIQGVKSSYYVYYPKRDKFAKIIVTDRKTTIIYLTYEKLLERFEQKAPTRWGNVVVTDRGKIILSHLKVQKKLSSEELSITKLD